MDLPKDMSAAAATPLVLSILRNGDSYGYAIIQQVRAVSGGRLEWADGMLYPILHRLERKGWIASYWGQSDSGRRRKYYRLLNPGLRALKQQRRDWDAIQSMFRSLEEAT